MSRSRSELPLHVQRPIHGPNGEAILTLLTPSGGLLAGDEIDLHVECLSGADVLIRQTGATRLGRCDEEPIRFDATFYVSEGARLRFLPYELLPSAGADYIQNIHLLLEDGAEATFLEVISPGAGDPFAYQQIVLRMEAHLHRHPHPGSRSREGGTGEMILLDATRVFPADGDGILALGGHSHFATLHIFGPALGQSDADALHATLSNNGLVASATVLPHYGIGARLVGDSADAMLRALRSAYAPINLSLPEAGSLLRPNTVP
ncbi:MAG: urease accessory protein UreD [Chloroflexi bacterium]|nr:urease accessory protein UreD [Chloroflexota bacterium]